jgi:hypothetical protein
VFACYIDEIANSPSKLIQARFSLLLGYFSDLLFTEEPEAFRRTFFFMYQKVNLAGQDKVLALQTIDTLKTIACDKDLVKRIKEANLIPDMIELIKQSIQVIEHPDYFEFVKDFMVSFS